jgi:hypothetical protein
MIKYMDKVIIACLSFSAIAAVYLSVSDTLLYVG